MYNYAVAFYAVFVNELAVAGCIILSDGFANALLNVERLLEHTALKRVNSQCSG